MSTGLTIGRISLIEEFEILEEEWSQLSHVRTNPLLSHAWFLAAARALHSEDRLRVLVVRRNGHMSAGAPLVQVRRGRTTWLEIIGARDLCEPGGLPVDDLESMRLLCSVMVAESMPIALQRIDPASNLRWALSDASRGRGATLLVGSAPTLWVATDRNWEDLASTLTSRRRSDLRRARRALEGKGPVRVECLRPGPEEVHATLDCAFAIEAANWKGRSGTSIACRKPMRQFYEEMALSFAASRSLEVRFLHVGNTPVAMQIGLEYANRWWDLKIGYDDAYAKASPGLQLTAAGLREACQRRIASHEFLGSPANWERQWASGERMLETVVYYPYSVRGACAFIADIAASVAKRCQSPKRD